MGSSRKRPRTTPLTVDEPGSSKAADAETQSSATVAESSSNAPSTKDDASVHSKITVNNIKAGGDSTKDVSIYSPQPVFQMAVADPENSSNPRAVGMALGLGNLQLLPR